MQAITGCVAGDSVIIRDRVIIRGNAQALLAREPDLEVVGVAEDFESLGAGAAAGSEQVSVSDIRTPRVRRERIEDCQEIWKRNRGTGVVMLPQKDGPDYAIATPPEPPGAYAYLLNDRVGNRLSGTVREVATGGSMLDPSIVDARCRALPADCDLGAE